MENFDLYTCCFSGHRSIKLPWKYNEKGIRFLCCKLKLKKAIKKAIKKGYRLFVCGMALGSDILFAELVLSLKAKHLNIFLECAIPCVNQTEKWYPKSVARYNAILSKADFVTMVTDKKYTNGCMQKRNKYMLEKSSLLISVYDGTKGGTEQTVILAKQMGIETIIIKP